jgi:uncharacterized protein (UPF0333 family)
LKLQLHTNSYRAHIYEVAENYAQCHFENNTTISAVKIFGSQSQSFRP